MLRIRTFGGLSLEVDGHDLPPIGSHKAQAILIMLAVEGGRHQRSAVAAKFWPESTAANSQTALRVTLSLLRKSLVAYLEIGRDTIGVDRHAAIWIDTDEIERRLKARETAQALALYRGDFLEGFHVHGSPAFDDWRIWQQERYHRQVVDALHQQVAHAIEIADLACGQELALRLLELDPLDELSHRQQMQLLALDGQRNAALVQYETLRAILDAELGVEPSVESRQLHQQILTGQRPAPSRSPNRQSELPAYPTTFVGRQAEIADITTLLDQATCQILTLVGLGGIGKTRLAVEVARALTANFPDGVYFAALAPITAAEYLLPALGSALGFGFDGFVGTLAPRDQLFDYLSSRSLLLVLDSFEGHISEAPLLCELAVRAPGVKLLITSRERLNVQGEWVFPVEGLPLAGNGGALAPDADAAALFVDRATRVHRDFALTEGPADVTRVCRIVGGVPLAIELAAAWTPVLSCAEIAAELEQNLDILTARASDVPERHRSMRNVFDYSWRLLTSDQRDLLARLSIFRGGFTRATARRVAGADLAELGTLIGKSLLSPGSSGRFDLHPLLRQYAAEELEREPRIARRVRQRHGSFFLEFLQQREQQLMGPRMLAARHEIRTELANIQAAVERVVLLGTPSHALRALGALLAFYGVHGWHEGRMAFEHLASLRADIVPGEAVKDPVYLAARVRGAFYCSHLGLANLSEAISRECLEPVRELNLPAELALCLHNLGLNAALRGECAAAEDYLNEAIPLGRDSGEFAWPTYSLWLGYAPIIDGEYQRGIAVLEESRRYFETLGCAWGQAFALSKMGLGADGMKDYSLAMQFHRQALATFEIIEDKIGQAYTLSRMSIDAYGMAAYHDAANLARAACAIFQEFGHRWGMSASLSRLGFASVGLGQLAEAEQYFQEALRLARESEIVPLALYAQTGHACIAAKRQDAARAAKLFALVRRHPQMSTLYLDLASRWLTGLAGNGEYLAAEPSDTEGEISNIWW